jgi:DNA-binding HxlR family transcriptional regulator
MQATTPRRLAAPGSAAAEDCSVLRTLAVVGDFWTLGVLRCAVFGLRRFGDIQRELGVATNVLANRLARLVDAGVLDRVPSPGRAGRHDYLLTAKGRELTPVVLALKAWGDRHEQPDGPVTAVRHRDCGGDVVVRPRCARCDAAPDEAGLEAVAL